MQRELNPPRESVVDMALLMEEYLKRHEDYWITGDQVMDLHRLKSKLAEKERTLDDAISRVRLQGTFLTLTPPQKAALREEAVGLACMCMMVLEVCQLLDSSIEL